SVTLPLVGRVGARQRAGVGVACLHTHVPASVARMSAAKSGAGPCPAFRFASCGLRLVGPHRPARVARMSAAKSGVAPHSASLHAGYGWSVRIGLRYRFTLPASVGTKAGSQP